MFTDVYRTYYTSICSTAPCLICLNFFWSDRRRNKDRRRTYKWTDRQTDRHASQDFDWLSSQADQLDLSVIFGVRIDIKPPATKQQAEQRSILVRKVKKSTVKTTSQPTRDRDSAQLDQIVCVVLPQPHLGNNSHCMYDRSSYGSTIVSTESKDARKQNRALQKKQSFFL